jgi:hypothetical protein
MTVNDQAKLISTCLGIALLILCLVMVYRVWMDYTITIERDRSGEATPVKIIEGKPTIIEEREVSVNP